MTQNGPAHPQRVLSIQSHVVHGYVGGKAAVFPLQLLGFDVDIVNTVHFSNHSGYGPGRFGGTKASAKDLDDLFERLEGNEMIQVNERVITGYVPGPEALKVISRFVRRMKEKNKDLIYVLDPVMGDAGKLYVSPEVVPIYKEMLPLATIITPNWFEVETLTGKKLDSVNGLRDALRILHEEYNVKDVVVTSIPLIQGEGLERELPEDIRRSGVGEGEDNDEVLLCVSSSQREDGKRLTHAMRVRKIEGYFSGVGDLFSALVCGHYRPASITVSSPAAAAASRPQAQMGAATQSILGAVPPNHISMTFARPSPPQTPIAHATYMALLKTVHILRATQDYFVSTYSEGEEVNMTDGEKDKLDPMRVVRRMRGRELRLVQCQDVLRRRVFGEFGMRAIGDDGMIYWENFWEDNNN